MSKDKKRLVPVRRFKEFENADAWEQRKLGEVVEITMGQSPSSKNYTENPNDHILVQGNADMKNGYVVPRVWTTQITKQAEKGDLILSVRAPVGDIGKTDYDVVLGRGVAAIKGNSFIFQLLTKMKINGYWTRFSTGSTFESINSDNIKNAQISIPSLREQEKIGGLFNEFDSLIALHQRKLDKLKRVKSAYLTEMFPAEGEREPKRRFPGFTGAWEQRKLGDVADIVGGGTPSTKVKEYWNGNINWYSPVEIGNSIYASGSVKRITELGLEKSSAKILPKGTVLFTSRAGIGNTAILSKEAATNQGFQSIVPKKKLLDSYFIFTETPFLKKYGEINGAGSTFVEVSGKQMAKMPLRLPLLEEQKKIGVFFKQIDSLIALHQRKLDKLQKLKNAYLNEMFV
ncbi:restriction endonuclease subunit S [Limosilactobacillus reuteri subsp. suis]|uniref:restriction endonuclease subunit S n=1 Tax=Limosilactobacillus reuteri TaxID=1598 RepID=UPI003993C63A